MRPELALDIPWDKPTGERNGHQYYDVRCRVPFQGFDVSSDVEVRAGGMPITVESKAGDGDTVTVEGVASSTGVDWYGTEMSREALEMMADQMKAGVAYVPTHWSAEWMDEMGRTVHAEVKRGYVENAANGDEEQYRLHMRAELDADNEMTQKLVARARKGQRIGQSIGGYFTNVRFIEEYGDGEEDYNLRIIILGVELDHLAGTRTPANRDSWIENLRAAVSPSLEARAASVSGSAASVHAAPPPADAPLQTAQKRHIAQVTEDDDTFTVVFTKAGAVSGEGDGDGEEEEDRAAPSSGTSSAAPADTATSAAPDTAPDTDQDAHADTSPDTRTATGALDLPLADEDTEWDWSTEASNAVLGDDNWKRYGRAHFYTDPEKAESKAGYKLPFAKMMDGTLTAVWRGVSAAMAALNGARGGVDIPEDEREAVYQRVVRYYERFDKEAPELQRSAPGLDTSHESGHDTGSDARRGASDPQPDDPAPPETESTTMSENKAILDALAALTDEIRGLRSESAKTEPPPESDPEPATDPEPNIRAIVTDVVKQVLAETEPTERRGTRQEPPEPEEEHVLDIYVRAAERVGADSLQQWLSDNERAERLTDDEPGNFIARRRKAGRDLRSFLNAALEDGVLNDDRGRGSAW